VETILVTGGAGFLGGWFVRRWLADRPGRIVVLDKLTYAGSVASLASVHREERLFFHRGDIGDGPFVARLLVQYRPRAIVNFAAESHVDRSIDAPAPFVSANVVGTCQLLDESLSYWHRLPDAQRRSFRFLHVSTDEVYGSIFEPGRAEESDRYRPSSPYAASKAAADHFVRAYHRTYGLPVLVVHPSNCYGPLQFPEKLVPLMTLNAIDGNPLPIYGDGRQRRDWLFGEDLCRAVCDVLDHGQLGEAFNVATGVETPNGDLVRRICRLVDQLVPNLPHAPSTTLIRNVEDRPGHDERYALDTAKIERLGWRPRVMLDDGLEQTVRWYVENRAWVDQVAASFDRTKRMGVVAS